MTPWRGASAIWVLAPPYEPVNGRGCGQGNLKPVAVSAEHGSVDFVHDAIKETADFIEPPLEVAGGRVRWRAQLKANLATAPQRRLFAADHDALNACVSAQNYQFWLRCHVRDPDEVGVQCLAGKGP